MSKLDDFNKEQQKARVANSILNDEAKKSIFDGTYKVSGGTTSRHLVSQKDRSHGFGSLSKEEANQVKSVVEGIFKGTVEGLQQADAAISESVTNLTSWQNPAQYVGTMFKTLREGTKVGKHTIFAMDTEWLGGGKFGSAMPVELGIQPIDIVNGQVQDLRNFKPITLAVQLSDADAKMISVLIKRLEDAKRTGIKPQLNDDEYRTLKDLINYGGKTTIDPNGIINRATQNAMVDKQNIVNYIEEIKDGFSVLDPSGQTTKTKAIKRTEFATKVASIVKDGGYKIGSDPTFVWHNGLNTDVNNWEKAFGADVAEVFGFGGTARHIDTLTFLRATNPNLVDLYKDSIKKGSKIKGPGRLESIAEHILGVKYAAHVAGEDAKVGAMLFQYIWDQGKEINVSNKTFKAQKLFATGSIRRDIENNPFDIAFTVGDNGEINYRGYQGVATYKNAIHKINKEFEYEFGGKKYYGVVLHNTDDNVYSVVARHNLRDLQNVIQSNFVSASKMNRGGDKQVNALRQHIMKTRAIGEYNRMFSGEAGAYGMFTKYMDAVKYIRDSKLDVSMKDDMLNDMTINKLVSKGKLSHAQAQKFKYMYGRLSSEYDILHEARTEFDKFGSKELTQKSTALALYKDELETILAEDGGRFTENIDISKLSKDAYNQARIYDPVSKTYKTVDARSVDTLATSLYGIATGGAYGNPKYNFADAKYRLNRVVHQLAAENALEAGKAKELLSTMDSVIGFEDGTRGARNIAEYLATHLLPVVQQHKMYNVIEDQEKLSTRHFSQKSISKVRERSLAKTVYGQVSNFFNVEGTLAFYDSKIPSKLKELDSSIRHHVGKFSDVIARDPGLGPTSLLDNLESLAKSYYDRGIGVDIKLAEDRKSTGLIMTLYDRETTSKVFSPTRKNSAQVFIPLLDPKTGLLTVDGVQSVNILRPVMRNGSIAMETYQNKAFEVLRFPGVADDIVGMIKNGDIMGAQSRAKSTLKWAMKGIPSGSRYSMDEVIDDLTASTKLANMNRSAMIDFNDLIYSVTGGKSFKELGGVDTFMRHLLYNDEAMGYLGERNSYAAKIKNWMNNGLGIQYDVSGIKGERALMGFASVAKYDPRRYIPFGYHNDTGRENARQALNYFEFKNDDIMRVADPTSKSGYRVLRRSDMLSKFSPDVRNRLTSNFIATESYMRDVGGDSISYNLNTAFLTDAYINDIATSNAGKGKLEDTHMLNRLTVHDDMMIIRQDVAELYTSMQSKRIHLPSDYSVRNSLQVGQWINQGWSLNEAVPGMQNFTYDDKYDAIVRAIEKNKDGTGYDIVLDQVIGFREGMKLQGAMGGNKFTSHIAVMSNNEIVNQLGAQFKDTEAIVKIGTKKMPSEIVNSQLALLMSEMNKQVTVGKLTTQKRREYVEEVLSALLSNPGDAIRKAKINAQGTLILPDVISSNMKPQKAFDAIEKILGTLGVASNVVAQHRMGAATDATKIYRGLMGFRRVNQEDWVRTAGAGQGLVKYTWRELEMLENRQHLVGNADIGGVIGAIERRMMENAKPFAGEGAQLFNVLKDGRGMVNPNGANIPTIKTRGYINSDRVDKGFQRDFSSIAPLPSESRAYLASEINGTILDPKLFNGKSFYMELPESVRVGGRDIDKVLMPALHIRGQADEIYSAGVQQAQRGIYEAVKDWRTNYQGATAEEAKALSARLTRSVDNYYQEVKKATFDPHGYIMQNTMVGAMEHSGHFTYRGLRPADLEFGIGKTLKDGEALVARADLENMLSGIGKKRVNEIMTQAETSGYSAIGNRYPTKEFSSILPMKLKVMTAAEEAAIEQQLGKGGLRGNIWVTVGTQMRHGADHDSDTMAVILPQLAGKKVKVAESKIIEKQLDNWYANEQKFTEATGDYFRKNIYDGLKNAAGVISKYDDSINIADEVVARVGNTGADHVVGIESRLMKMVGRFSNMNTAYRRMAETVGSMTKDMTAYNVLTYFGTAVEQAPISSKRIGELMERSVGNKAEYGKYIGAVGNLYASLQNFEIDGIIDSAKTLGFFEQQDGKWYFAGATKGEGARAAIELGRDPVTERITETEVRDALSSVKKHMPDNPVYNVFNKMGLMDMGTTQETFNAVGQIANPNTTHPMKFGTVERMLGILGQDESLRQLEEQTGKMMNVKAYLETPGGSVASNVIHDAPADIETVGSTVASALKGAAGEALGNIKTSAGLYGAVALGGMWAAGAIMGGPDRIREVNQSIPDQAPSSDGQYVDPTPYAAGAPMGAGPTARLAPKGHQRVNIKIDARSMNGLTNEEIAQVVSQEVQRQSGMNLNINVTSQDDRTSIDKSWVQEQFASALKTGFVY